MILVCARCCVSSFQNIALMHAPLHSTTVCVPMMAVSPLFVPTTMMPTEFMLPRSTSKSVFDIARCVRCLNFLFKDLMLNDLIRMCCFFLTRDPHESSPTIPSGTDQGYHYWRLSQYVNPECTPIIVFQLLNSS